jgi:hypothetical protein
MPSNNLNFANKFDVARFKAKCEDQRRIATKWPAYDARMAGVDVFGWLLGPWSLRFMLEVWQKPFVWHGSAAILEQIGYTTETGKLGMKYEVPQDAMLSTSSWVEEHKEQARFILAEIFGEILRPNDKFQPANETIGLLCMHWHVLYEGKKYWLSRQN